MSSLPAVPETSLIDALEELPELRPFPTVASQLMATCEDADASPNEIATIIQCDPVISLRLVRVANSSMYGFSGEVRSVQHAIVVLGFRAVRDMAVSLAAADLFTQGAAEKAALQDIWKHSVACAAVARLLANRLPELGPEEAFLAAILHDVGKLVFYDLAAEEYRSLQASCPTDSVVEAELRKFGTTHPELGLRCAEEWGLPAEINEAICFHHSPEDADFAGELVDLIAVSNSLVKLWGLGSVASNELAVDQVLQSSRLPIEPAVLQEVEERAPAEFKSIMSCIG